MIKLNRAIAPSYLDTAKVRELTDEYIATGKSVWNNKNIKEPLLASSNEKCAYCECKINIESKYMEVEHFEYKDSNPTKVVDWNNLLPSCKRCNGAKGTHDVLTEPIVNPFDIHPKDHLKLKLYRLKKKTDIGQYTIDALDLNNSDRAVLKRFEIGEKVISAIEDSWEKYDIWKSKKSTRSRNKLLASIDGLLLECQPSSSYSATAATVLHNEQEYLKLVATLKSDNLWTNELDNLHNNSNALVLDC